MFPLRDLNRASRTPFVTWFLIAASCLVWLVAWSRGAATVDRFVHVFGVVPRALLTAPDAATLATPLTSMFVHASWLHLLGNAWFLHVFGDNVEDHLGHARFAIFYVLAGLCALAAQVVLDPFGTLPIVGASGAIAGVMGAYVLRFPRAPVITWWVIGVVELPAFAYLFLWFLYQLLMAWGAFGAEQSGGVAFAAHVGGFVAGMALQVLLGPGKEELQRRELEARTRRARNLKRMP